MKELFINTDILANTAFDSPIHNPKHTSFCQFVVWETPENPCSEEAKSLLSRVFSALKRNDIGYDIVVVTTPIPLSYLLHNCQGKAIILFAPIQQQILHQMEQLPEQVVFTIQKRNILCTYNLDILLNPASKVQKNHFWHLFQQIIQTASV